MVKQISKIENINPTVPTFSNATSRHTPIRCLAHETTLRRQSGETSKREKGESTEVTTINVNSVSFGSTRRENRTLQSRREKSLELTSGQVVLASGSFQRAPVLHNQAQQDAATGGRHTKPTDTSRRRLYSGFGTDFFVSMESQVGRRASFRRFPARRTKTEPTPDKEAVPGTAERISGRHRVWRRQWCGVGAKKVRLGVEQ